MAFSGVIRRILTAEPRANDRLVRIEFDAVRQLTAVHPAETFATKRLQCTVGTRQKAFEQPAVQPVSQDFTCSYRAAFGRLLSIDFAFSF